MVAYHEGKLKETFDRNSFHMLQWLQEQAYAFKENRLSLEQVELLKAFSFWNDGALTVARCNAYFHRDARFLDNNLQPLFASSFLVFLRENNINGLHALLSITEEELHQMRRRSRTSEYEDQRFRDKIRRGILKAIAFKSSGNYYAYSLLTGISLEEVKRISEPEQLSVRLQYLVSMYVTDSIAHGLSKMLRGSKLADAAMVASTTGSSLSSQIDNAVSKILSNPEQREHLLFDGVKPTENRLSGLCEAVEFKYSESSRVPLENLRRYCETLIKLISEREHLEMYVLTEDEVLSAIECAVLAIDRHTEYNLLTILTDGVGGYPVDEITSTEVKDSNLSVLLSRAYRLRGILEHYLG
jgi:hypothetical protein